MPPAKKISFPKADPGALAFFDDLVPRGTGVTVKPMFGHKAAFVNGTMFLGVFSDRVLVRLGSDDHAALMAEDGAAPFEPMKGRPMREYVLLPAGWIDEPNTARPWVAKALAFARSLPPKKPAAQKPAAQKPAAQKPAAQKKAAPSARKAAPQKKAAARKAPTRKSSRAT